MARGGYRPGAGRPKGSGVTIETKAEIPVAAAAENLTPLESMLRVMNDRSADDHRRDRMAVAAAPYVHAKAETAAPGKKEQREMDALRAERGTDWEAVLQ